MDSFPVIVDQLEDKVLALIAKKEKISAELMTLKKEAEQLQQQNKSLSKTVEQLKEKNQILRLTSGGKSKEEQREMKVRINEIVREVDKCISQLNQ